MELNLQNIVDYTIAKFPEVFEKYDCKYNVIRDFDGSIMVYSFFESVIRKHFMNLIDRYYESADSDVFASIKKMTSFFEELATSPNREMENLLYCGVMEGITQDPNKEALIRSLLEENSKLYI